MTAIIARRALALLPVLIGASILTFVVGRLAPGDPAQLALGQWGTPAEIEALRHEMGLDRSWPAQFGIWLKGVAAGDLGISYSKHRPVLDILLERGWNTALLAVAGVGISATLGISLGIMSAVKQGSVWDRLLGLFSVFGISMPTFWFGLLLILAFAGWLKWLPVGGMRSIDGGGPLDLLKHLLMPAITLGISATGFMARYTRSSMLEVLRQDYMRTARSKGLREHTVILQHGLRNAVIPIISLLALQLGFLLGGTVIVETVFSWPGLGSEVFAAISTRDYALIQGVVVFFALVFVLANLCADLLSSYLNPVARFG